LSQYTSEEASIDRINEYRQSRVKTAIPAVVTSYNMAEQTVNVLIPYEEAYETAEGDETEPWGELHDVPVQFSSGGPVSSTFPIEKDDQVLLVFSCRSIDEWYGSNGKQVIEPLSIRMHDVSDAFAIPGIRTKENKLPSDAVSADGWVLKSGDSRIEAKKSGPIDTTCTRLNIGAPSASSALAKAPATDTRFSDIETKINLIISVSSASGGLIPPGSVLPLTPGASTASGKAFTND